jgi:hypothetical protein
MVCEYDPPGNVIGEFRENISKEGIGKDGKMGFGAAPSIRGSVSRMLVALVAVSSFVVAYL